MKKRIVTIVGTRPNFIKAAPVSNLFAKKPNVEEIIIHTGQHFDYSMSEIFFTELNIPRPKYVLDINDCKHGQMTGRILESVEKILLEEQPDAALVYGDTNSTLAGALAAAKLHIPLIHIEAGLRSFVKTMPEEINRVLTDHVSAVLCCPTQVAVDNLAKEGITKDVYHTGDVMYDAALLAVEMLKNNKQLAENANILKNDYAFLTIHRAESTDSIDKLCTLLKFATDFAYGKNLQIIFPVHPRTRKLLQEIPGTNFKNVQFIEPLSYFETQAYLTKAKYVLTDSGGLQKEAYFHRVPCITLRSETEWVETIELGWNRLWTEDTYKSRKEIDEYGSGKAAEIITNIIYNKICQ